MKALKIYETISFERGGDPKESMRIGSEEFRMVNEVNKELKPLGFVKTGEKDMGSQSHYMKSLEEWQKTNSPKTRINLYFMNWYGSEVYQFSISINGRSYSSGNDGADWHDFKHKNSNWTNAINIIKFLDLKPGSILEAQEKCVISSKLHEFRLLKEQRKLDYIIEKNEQIQITDIDLNEPKLWGGIKVSYANTYFICPAEDLYQRFNIIKI